MTQITNEYESGELEALAMLGLSKEAMEKAAYWGLLKGIGHGLKMGGNHLKSGLGKGINAVTSAFKPTSKAGLKMVGNANNSMKTLNAKRTYELDKTRRLGNVTSAQKTRIQGDSTFGGSGIGGTNTMPNAPRFQPSQSERLQRSVQKRKLRTQQRQETIRRNNSQKIPKKTPKTPTEPKSTYLADKQKEIIDWSKENPLLATGGGMVGYDMYRGNRNNSGGATIVNN